MKLVSIAEVQPIFCKDKFFILLNPNHAEINCKKPLTDNKNDSFCKKLVKTFGGIKTNAYLCNRLQSNMGKSCTASSLRTLQDGNVAKVVGCSGAM